MDERVHVTDAPLCLNKNWRYPKLKPSLLSVQGLSVLWPSPLQSVSSLAYFEVATIKLYIRSKIKETIKLTFFNSLVGQGLQ